MTLVGSGNRELKHARHSCSLLDAIRAQPAAKRSSSSRTLTSGYHLIPWLLWKVSEFHSQLWQILPVALARPCTLYSLTPAHSHNDRSSNEEFVSCRAVYLIISLLVLLITGLRPSSHNKNFRVFESFKSSLVVSHVVRANSWKTGPPMCELSLISSIFSTLPWATCRVRSSMCHLEHYQGRIDC